MPRKIAIVCVALALCRYVPVWASDPAPSGGELTRDIFMSSLTDEGFESLGFCTVSEAGSVEAARARAETYAREGIVEHLNYIASNMIRDYAASSTVDPSAVLAFQENVREWLFFTSAPSGVVIDEEAWEGDEDSEWVVMVTLTNDNAARAISLAVEVAKFEVPAMASFDAEARMNEAFAQRLNSIVSSVYSYYRGAGP